MSKRISKRKEKPPKQVRGRAKTTPLSPSSTLDSWILRDQNRVHKRETNPPKNEDKITKSNNSVEIPKTELNHLKKTTKLYNGTPIKAQTSKKKSQASETEDPTKQNNSRTLKRHPSGSFQKYGVILPTYEEALLHKEELEEMKLAIADFDLSNDSISDFEVEIDEPKPIKILDCKHLSDEKLKDELKLNHQYLYDIIHGVRKSERHDTFMNSLYKTGTQTDLIHNTSMITFTFAQKQLLLKYLTKKFGDNNQYFFKVLLPELCTKIFMDTHNMTYSEAVSYLNARPAKPIDFV